MPCCALSSIMQVRQLPPQNAQLAQKQTARNCGQAAHALNEHSNLSGATTPHGTFMTPKQHHGGTYPTRHGTYTARLRHRDSTQPAPLRHHNSTQHLN